MTVLCVTMIKVTLDLTVTYVGDEPLTVQPVEPGQICAVCRRCTSLLV